MTDGQDEARARTGADPGPGDGSPVLDSDQPAEPWSPEVLNRQIAEMATSGQTALYHVHGKSDLLYIGVSNNFGRRWAEHARKQPWWNKRQRMTVDWYNTRAEALDAEGARDLRRAT